MVKSLYFAFDPFDLPRLTPLTFLYERVKDKVVGFNAEELSQAIRVRKDICDRIIGAFSRSDIVQLNQIGRIQGIGIKTLEKVFGWAIEPTQNQQGNLPL